ncbi:preprotein translocase subunit SecE [Candidatus Peregrinibacteria bacterium]|nr:preprotein translocase subunit SecE [Candidatus Peregrinibacteria bacterium]
MLNATFAYIDEAIQELELVRWPTRQQAVRLSAVVLAFTLVSSAAFGVVDFILSSVVRFLLSLAF